MGTARSRLPGVLVHIGFLALGLLANHFRLERLYLDSSYYLFHTINDGWFRVEHQRFVLAFSELPVLLATWLTIGVKPLIVIWSLTHVLWPWLAAWWLMGRWKRVDLAAAMLLLQVVGLRELYFSPMMEIFYGAIFALLLVGLADRDPGLSKRLSLGAWCAFALLLVTSHPEHLITYLVIVALFLPWRADLKRSLALLTLPIAVLVAMKLAFLSDYEAGRFAAVTSPFGQGGDFGGNVMRALHAGFELMPESLMLVVICGIIGWRSQLFVNAAAPLLGTFLLLVAVSLARSIHGVDRDLESAFFPITVIALVACCSIRSSGSRIPAGVLLFTAVSLFTLRVTTVTRASTPFTSRVEALDAICAQALSAGKPKVIVPFERTRPLYHWEWSAPMESLLLSAADHTACVSILTTEDLVVIPSLSSLNEHQVVLRRWDVKRATQLREPWNALDATTYAELGE